MQYAYAKYFTLPFNMPTYGREREYFILFQNQKYFQTTVLNKKSKTSSTFQTDFSFPKAMRRGRISFPTIKTRSTLHANALYFQFY